MKRLPFVALVIVLTISFFTFKSSLAFNSQPPGRYEKIMGLVGQMLTYGHFSPKPIDDNFSQIVLNKYIEDLDGEKNIFLKSDVAELKQQYGNRIDDELQGAKVESFRAVSSIFINRLKQSEQWSKEFLAKPFDYSIKETVQFDGKLIDFPSSEADRKDRWRKKVKFYALERYVEMMDEREANKGKKDFTVKSDAQIEKDARAKTDTILTRMFSRYWTKYTEEESFNMFVNAISNTMDPHTEFLPPLDNRYFDEQMSGSFFGIGAALQYTDGGIKITSINPGSPSAKSGQLAPGDMITKVAQGDEPAVDMMGFSVEDAVKLIRGKEGSIVTLTVRKPDATIKTVKLKREKIENVETFARSVIIKDSINKSKVGLIYLPEFYADFENPNGRRSYIDVAREIEKLKAEKVDGIIMDLRFNGGGSLYDVVQMAGLFIEKGPIVQVKERSGKPTIWNDRDESVAYSGPLAVMVNEFSASASEIFAAAIQDYGRGVIIGGTSTFGKGTVQRKIPLNPGGNFFSRDSDLGAQKITIQKYYRITGGSTQLNGVVSDIILPSQMEAIKMREKDNEFSMPYDVIEKANYTPWGGASDLNTVKQLSAERVAKDSVFRIIKENTNWLAAQDTKSMPLNLEDYRQIKKEMKARSSKISSVLKLKNKLSVNLLPDEREIYKDDVARKERTEQWLKGMREDIYLNQAVKVVEDMIGIDKMAKNQQ